MTQRIDYPSAAPETLAAMSGLESYVRRCGLPNVAKSGQHLAQRLHDRVGQRHHTRLFI
jgi:hypothetical protein